MAYTFDLQATQHDETSWLLYNAVGGSVALVIGSRMTTHTFMAFIYQQRKLHGIVQLLLSWSFIKIYWYQKQITLIFQIQEVCLNTG